MEHDLFGKPASTFPDHALTDTLPRLSSRRRGGGAKKQIFVRKRQFFGERSVYEQAPDGRRRLNRLV
jgi:hypothetical protein